MTINIAVRLYQQRTLIDHKHIALTGDETDDAIKHLAIEHTMRLAARDQPYMVELEFLDEPDVTKRFFRFGTDPSQMVVPARLYEPR